MLVEVVRVDEEEGGRRRALEARYRGRTV